MILEPSNNFYANHILGLQTLEPRIICRTVALHQKETFYWLLYLQQFHRLWLGQRERLLAALPSFLPVSSIDSDLWKLGLFQVFLLQPLEKS